MAVSTFTAEDYARMEAEIEIGLGVSGVATDIYKPPEEEIDMDTVSIVKEVAETLRSPAFQKLLEEISKVTAPGAMIKDTITKDDPEYKLVHDAMKSCVTLQTEIARVHKFIRHKYKKYYKELEQFVVEPIQYSRIVKIIRNDIDLEPYVDTLRSYGFDSTTIAKVIVTRSTCTMAENPSLNELKCIEEACDEMMSLEEAKQFVLEYTQLRMNHIAPNVSAIVGTAIAAQLIGIVGGLDNLTKLPADHLPNLGKSQNLDGENRADQSQYHGCFLLNCDIVKSQEPDFRDRALKMVSNKIILAARIDANRFAPDGSKGALLREKIIRQIDGILDGTIQSTYKPSFQRKRPREQQDLAILAAARNELAMRQQITAGPVGYSPYQVAPPQPAIPPQYQHH
eukprot:TRINITY_DN4734_c0_g1_i1.p1 TRINITY_DN4734_c0_g1~~TRINITY_DN4734_c0_g1_i1.p1  ORF type:complete len:397 (+),score=65.84 TRINITY_DN4734_c0_g1_i1:92-1282(+)